ncbi:hypothetical protein J6590_026812, partial [Homalodisca vitripennis]
LAGWYRRTHTGARNSWCIPLISVALDVNTEWRSGKGGLGLPWVAMRKYAVAAQYTTWPGVPSSHPPPPAHSPPNAVLSIHLQNKQIYHEAFGKIIVREDYTWPMVCETPYIHFQSHSSEVKLFILASISTERLHPDTAASRIDNAAPQVVMASESCSSSSCCT